MIGPSIIVPPLTLWSRNGDVDCGATAAYAQRAAASWIDFFMLSGSIGGGKTSSPSTRRLTAEVWARIVPPERLFGCAWGKEDYACLRDLGIRPMVVLQDLRDTESLVRFFATMPAGAFFYSHPDYTSTTFTAAAAARAVRAGVLPAGVKLSKVTPDEIRAVRDAAGPGFLLYDGRSRHLAASLAAGATGVVAVPLSLIPDNLPARADVAALQQVIDEVQLQLDTREGIPAQARLLTSLLRSTL